jgi:hypothetical protein
MIKKYVVDHFIKNKNDIFTYAIKACSGGKGKLGAEGELRTVKG